MKTKDMLTLRVGDQVRLRGRLYARHDARDDEAATIVEVRSLDVTYVPPSSGWSPRHQTRVDGEVLQLAGGFRPRRGDGGAVIVRDVKEINSYSDSDEWRIRKTPRLWEVKARDIAELWTPERETEFMELRRERRAQREQDRLDAAARKERAAVERLAARDRLRELLGDEQVARLSVFNPQLDRPLEVTAAKLVAIIESALSRAEGGKS